MALDRGRIRLLEGRGPAAARVRAAVLAAIAAPGGCAVAALEDRVAAFLGLARGAQLRRAVEDALGLLVVTGSVDEVGGQLVLTLRARAAV